MNIITLDFETYFDADYTLSKMTIEAYVRDPRFEAHGVGVRWNNGDTVWYSDERLQVGLQALFDCKDAVFLAHHTHFDGLILEHHYGIRPALWLDTLSMARMLVGSQLSVSLASLSAHFHLATKNVPYDLFKGKHWHELAPAVQKQVADGCLHDVELTWQIFNLLAPSFPAEEYALVDATVRMFTEPCLVGDTALLAQIWRQEQHARSELLRELEVEEYTDKKTGKLKSDLTKDWFFAKLLRAIGVEPEQKRGKDDKDGQERWIYSFAKTDDFMRDLLDGEDERAAMLAEARLAAKSNGVQTRSERLGWMSTRGALPVYLNFSGAHTTRWSGGDAVNWQNLKRGGPIAEAVEAPQGHLLVVNDASQIECRLLNMVAGQGDVIDRFRNREDPYISIASQFYGFAVTKAHEKERGTGKQLELSCGYGAGADTIKATAKKGTYGPPVYLTDEQALQARDLYRSTHPGVVALWATASDVLTKLSNGLSFAWGPYFIKEKRVYLPNGAPLIYESLEWHVDDAGNKGWRVLTRKHLWTRMYGAKLVENLIQALARVHVSQAWLRCREAGIHVVSMEHDKLIACVREHEAQDALAFMKVEMSREPEWLPGVPLDSEGYVSRTLAKQKY